MNEFFEWVIVYELTLVKRGHTFILIFLAVINEWRSLQMEFQIFVIKWIKHYTLLEGCDISNVEQGIGSHASL